jgi:aspartyl protease family protein
MAKGDHMKKLLLLVLLCVLCSASWSNQNVTVKGLFKGAVLLVINGEQVLIKEGKTKKGVKLITANSRDALLEINGKRQRLEISSQVGGQYQQAEKKSVRISSSQGGHHWVRGQINGRSVDFVVDTGASLIALNLSTAKRLGINYQQGKKGYSSTANGVREIRLVTLNKVAVGEIIKYNVEASVGLDDSLPVSLLGNSFLSQTNMRTENGVLVLETR